MVELIEEFNHERKVVGKAAIRIGIGGRHTAPVEVFSVMVGQLHAQT